jgi:predicted regulator of Ras-like GTPase activity (Roadblock/LC7/MglB family)
MSLHFILYEEEAQKIKSVCDTLLEDANATIVFLVDMNGQVLSHAGDVADKDMTSLASLTAGNVAATGGIAKLISEKEFTQIFHEGERDHLHISVHGGRFILVVIFDHRSSIGLVRLRVRQSSHQLRGILTAIEQKSQTAQGEKTPFAEITDEDIDNLFSL